MLVLLVLKGERRERYTHDISLRANGHQTVDVLADRHQHLSSHMSTLLRARRLILNVNSGCSLLNEQLGELHDGSQTTVAGVSIGDDGTQVVDVGQLGAVGFGGGGYAFFALLAVVEELGHEEVADLVGNGGLEGLDGLVGGGGGEDVRMGNLPNLVLARLRQRQWMMIASRKRRRYRGIWPSGSTSWAPSIRT